MISRRRLLAVTRKEFLHVGRDWRSLGLAIAIPMLLISLFGYALNLDVNNVPTVVWDQSHTPASRDFISLFSGSPYFAVQGSFDNYRDLEFAFGSSRALVALVIPSDFADSINGGGEATVQVLIDGSDANTARLVQGYVTALGAIYNQRLRLDFRHRTGIAAPAALELSPRAWYNPDLRSTNNIVPGIIVIVMMVIAALLTSVTIAKEWELGTMEQLISTPVRAPELVLGKLIPYFVIGLFDVAVGVAMGQWVFHVPLRGNVALVFSMASIFLAGALSLGITISINLKRQVLATQIALLGTYLPALLLSGFVFAIPNMPRTIQYLTFFIPARYFVELLRGIYLKGVGLEILWFNAALLTLWALIMLAVANRRLKLKLE